MTDTTDDIISVSDITTRVEELRYERELCNHANECYSDDDTRTEEQRIADAIAAFEASDEAKELAMLEALLEELCGYGGDHQWEGDWYPQCLIARSHFETYMDEMVSDCYEVPKDLPSWMSITLDYVALEQDYSSVDVDGNEYLYR